MSRRIAIGIDPGLDGAIALIVNGRPTEVVDMPTMTAKVGKTNKRTVVPALVAFELRNMALNEMTDAPHIIIEKVHAMPGQGVTSMFNFGRSFGVIEGVVAGLNWPVTYVTPQVWKKQAGIPPKADKDESRLLCIQKFPEFADELWLKKHNGRADAILIGRAG